MIRVDGPRFVDDRGGTLILRGVNIGGSSKLPMGPPGSVSFIGRPFPLAEAEEHFRRLRDWGMRFNRFLVTWEAVEHRGPGEYDREYLEFLEAVLARGAALGLRFVVDFHQDVWSRFTGGDGAPGWTLELPGLNARTLHATAAAVLHAELGGRMPNLLWPTNHWKLGAATMTTLLFGADAFAPELRVESVTIQSFLQSRYAAFVQEVVRRLSHVDAVCGYDLMNEPMPGYIGYPDLSSDRSMFVRNGVTPSPFDGMAAGSGFPRTVPVYRQTLLGPLRVGRSTINPQRMSAWLPGSSCPWLRHGVWGVRAGTPLLLRPDYFATVGGRRVSFGADFLRPFLSRIGRAVRAVAPDAILFVEDSPQRLELRWAPADGPNAAHAPHWYDALTMFRKHFAPGLCVAERTLRPSFGRRGVQRSFRDQIGALRETSERDLGGVPSFVGEFGLPFDLDGGEAFRTGGYRSQERALAAYYDALDANLLGGTLWNYTADNTHEHGDGWNSEDFSMYCPDHGDAGSGEGGRAVAGFCRPYAARIPGVPLRMCYEPSRRRFVLDYRSDPAARGDVEVYIPPQLAGPALSVRLSDGSWRYDAGTRTLFVTPDPARSEHGIVVEFLPMPSRASRRPGARS